MVDDPWILLKLLSFPHSYRYMHDERFLHSSWIWTPDSLSWKRSSNSKLSCKSKQFYTTSLEILNKLIILQINCWAFDFIVNLIMTMKIPEDFRALWTECFARNDLNALDGPKRFENETERFGDGTNRFEIETKRFGNGTKHFKNGRLLRCSSALQGLYLFVWVRQNHNISFLTLL